MEESMNENRFRSTIAKFRTQLTMLKVSTILEDETLAYLPAAYIYIEEKHKRKVDSLQLCSVTGLYSCALGQSSKTLEAIQILHVQLTIDLQLTQKSKPKHDQNNL